jgi:hypothetical protein
MFNPSPILPTTPQGLACRMAAASGSTGHSSNTSPEVPDGPIRNPWISAETHQTAEKGPASRSFFRIVQELDFLENRDPLLLLPRNFFVFFRSHPRRFRNPNHLSHQTKPAAS